MPRIWWLDARKRIEKIVGENAFEQKKKKPRSKFNARLALIGLRTTGSSDIKLEKRIVGGRSFFSNRD